MNLYESLSRRQRNPVVFIQAALSEPAGPNKAAAKPAETQCLAALTR
jgi:hypothetical protein